MENEKELSPNESLSIISSMIEKTKHSMSDSSHYFLLWGYAVFIACITQFSLMSAGYENHHMAWLIILPTMVLHFIFVARQSRKQKVSTYIGDANGYLWMGVGFSFMAVLFIFAKIGWQYSFPFYVLFYALGTFVSGSLVRFRPLVVGGIVSFFIAAGIAYLEYRWQILLTAVSILVSYIIPGHLLRAQYQKQIRLV